MSKNGKKETKFENSTTGKTNLTESNRQISDFSIEETSKEIKNDSFETPMRELKSDEIILTGKNPLGQNVVLTKTAYEKHILDRGRDITVNEIASTIVTPLLMFPDKGNFARVRSYSITSNPNATTAFVMVVTGTDNNFKDFDANVVTAFRKSDIPENMQELIYPVKKNEK